MEAFELFKAIWLERGYQQREIPQLILEKNLHGLDIDERAAQLTSFALMMKGRGDDRRLFDRGIQLNVIAMLNSDGLDVQALANAVNLADHGLKMADLLELKQLFEHATTFGSLIQVPDGLAQKLPALRRLSELKGQDMLVEKALKCLEPLIRQAELLAARYDAVVANPPYMGSKGMNPRLKNFINTHFPEAKSDLYACFIERGHSEAKPAARIAMVTLDGWMFLLSFSRLRHFLAQKSFIESLVHVGWNCFPQGHVYNRGTTFVSRNMLLTSRGSYLNLSDVPATVDKGNLFLGRSRDFKHYDFRDWSDFKKVPESPLAYWISVELRRKNIESFSACFNSKLSFFEVS